MKLKKEKEENKIEKEGKKVDRIKEGSNVVDEIKEGRRWKKREERKGKG
jgi:hypothetical protein